MSTTDRYRLEPAMLGEDWDRFVSASENGTVYARSAYLTGLGVRLGLYWCLNRDERRGAVLLVEDERGESARLHDLVVYGGLLMGPPTAGQNRAQRISERFRVAEFVATELCGRYREVSFALHPSFTDVRPFQWFRYGQPGPKYEMEARYTSHITISDFAGAAALDDIETYNQASKARRQEIRYAMEEGAHTEECFDSEIFLALYRRTFERQGINVEAQKLESLRSVLDALRASGLGRMFLGHAGSGELASAACFGVDNRRAYYLFGAGDPAVRGSHAGTLVLWDAFRMLSEAGVSEVDLEGVNSPRRGWFKLSFGGDLRLYHEVSYSAGGAR